MQKRIIVAGVLAFFVCLFALYCFLFSGPFSFQNGTYVKITAGDTVGEAGGKLSAGHVIRSATLFELLVRIYGRDTRIIAGEYFFPARQNIFSVVQRVVHGDYQLTPIRISIPEGTNTREMGQLFAKKIPDFDLKTFEALSKSKEGYLFPDTYFFFPGDDVETVLQKLETNFTNRVADPAVHKALSSFGKPLRDVIIMASLVEKEAPDTRNRRIIAGILWKRLAAGMPLQVDAVFPYITGKNYADITRADYASDSPYNTYLKKGLPPGPITNPGIDAIMAVVTPVSSNYLYYLSDRSGVFHYSATFEGQLQNQKKYLP